MRVRDRLVMSYLLIGAMLSIPSFFAVGRLGDLRDLAVRDRANHAEAALALGAVEAGLAELDGYLRSYVAAPDSSLRQGLFSSLEELRTQKDHFIRAGYANETGALVLELEELYSGTEGIDSLVQAGLLGEATDAFFSLQPGIQRASNGLGRIATDVDTRASADFERAEEISTSARDTTLLTALMGLVLVILVTGWITGILWSPLEKLRLALSRVAEGDYGIPENLPYDREDEIGELATSFRTMANRLEELDRLKAEFVGVASHELKTPINVIRGYTELIEEELAGELTPNQRDILDRIAEQTRSMTRMVSRLMDISRLETGGYNMELEVVLLQDVLLGLKRGFELLAQEQEIQLTFQVSDDAPVDVELDIDLFRGEVLGNLVSNALRFAPPGGEVRIIAKGKGEGVLFEVADNGPGIPPDHQKFVFDKYYRAERSKAMGAGLGLAIARELVEAHGGWIRLGEEGPDSLGGAIFHVWIPTRASESLEETS